MKSVDPLQRNEDREEICNQCYWSKDLSSKVETHLCFAQKRSVKITLIRSVPPRGVHLSRCMFRFSLDGSAGPPPPAAEVRSSTVFAGKVSFTKDATTRWWYIYGFRDRAGTRGGSWEPLFSGAPTPDERRKRRSQEGRGGIRRCRGFLSYAILLVLLHPWKWIVNDGSYLNHLLFAYFFSAVSLPLTRVALTFRDRSHLDSRRYHW